MEELIKIMGKRIYSAKCMNLEKQNILIEFTDGSAAIIHAGDGGFSLRYHAELNDAMVALAILTKDSFEKLECIARLEDNPDAINFNRKLNDKFIHLWGKAGPTAAYRKVEWEEFDTILSSLGMKKYIPS